MLHFLRLGSKISDAAATNYTTKISNFSLFVAPIHGYSFTHPSLSGQVKKENYISLAPIHSYSFTHPSLSHAHSHFLSLLARCRQRPRRRAAAAGCGAKAVDGCSDGGWESRGSCPLTGCISLFMLHLQKCCQATHRSSCSSWRHVHSAILARHCRLVRLAASFVGVMARSGGLAAAVNA